MENHRNQDKRHETSGSHFGGQPDLGHPPDMSRPNQARLPTSSQRVYDSSPAAGTNPVPRCHTPAEEDSSGNHEDSFELRNVRGTFQRVDKTAFPAAEAWRPEYPESARPKTSIYDVKTLEELEFDKLSKTDFSSSRPPRINLSGDLPERKARKAPIAKRVKTMLRLGSGKPPLEQPGSREWGYNELAGLPEVADDNQRKESPKVRLAHNEAPNAAGARQSVDVQSTPERDVEPQQAWSPPRFRKESGVSRSRNNHADTYDMENLHHDLHGTTTRPDYQGLANGSDRPNYRNGDTIESLVERYRGDQVCSPRLPERATELSNVAGRGMTFRPVHHHNNDFDKVTHQPGDDIFREEPTQAVHQKNLDLWEAAEMKHSKSKRVYHLRFGGDSPSKPPRQALPEVPSSYSVGNVSSSAGGVGLSSSYGNTGMLLNLTEEACSHLEEQRQLCREASRCLLPVPPVLSPRIVRSGLDFESSKERCVVPPTSKASPQLGYSQAKASGKSKANQRKDFPVEDGRQSRLGLERQVSAKLRRASGVCGSQSSIDSRDVRRKSSRERIESFVSDSSLGKWVDVLDRHGSIAELAGFGDDPAFYNSGAILENNTNLREKGQVKVEIQSQQKVVNNSDEVFVPDRKTRGGKDNSDEDKDWETVAESKADGGGKRVTLTPWANLGGPYAQAGSSLANTSDDGQTEVEFHALHNFSSREKILQHPADQSLDHDYRERSTAQGIPILLPHYGPHRVNGGFPQNSSRQPQFHFPADYISRLGGQLFGQTSRNPFISKPPKITTTNSTTQQSSKMSEEQVITDSQAPASDQGEPHDHVMPSSKSAHSFQAAAGGHYNEDSHVVAEPSTYEEYARRLLLQNRAKLSDDATRAPQDSGFNRANTDLAMEMEKKAQNTEHDGGGGGSGANMDKSLEQPMDRKGKGKEIIKFDLDEEDLASRRLSLWLERPNEETHSQNLGGGNAAKRHSVVKTYIPTGMDRSNSTSTPRKDQPVRTYIPRGPFIGQDKQPTGNEMARWEEAGKERRARVAAPLAVEEPAPDNGVHVQQVVHHVAEQNNQQVDQRVAHGSAEAQLSRKTINDLLRQKKISRRVLIASICLLGIGAPFVWLDCLNDPIAMATGGAVTSVTRDDKKIAKWFTLIYWPSFLMGLALVLVWVFIWRQQ